MAKHDIVNLEMQTPYFSACVPPLSRLVPMYAGLVNGVGTLPHTGRETKRTAPHNCHKEDLVRLCPAMRDSVKPHWTLRRLDLQCGARDVCLLDVLTPATSTRQVSP